MSGKLIFLFGALTTLSSAAVALTVAQSELGSFAAARNYPTKVDFDRTFAEFADMTPFDSESAAANREKLRAVGLKRMNSAQFGEEAKSLTATCRRAGEGDFNPPFICGFGLLSGNLLSGRTLTIW
jgi:hypothetical protein